MSIDMPSLRSLPSASHPIPVFSTTYRLPPTRHLNTLPMRSHSVS
ncbi:hypothetical protein [Anabaena azotica]|nr:hypothetical protein [Anabaena azotica]